MGCLVGWFNFQDYMRERKIEMLKRKKLIRVVMMMMKMNLFYPRMQLLLVFSLSRVKGFSKSSPPLLLFSITLALSPLAPLPSSNVDRHKRGLISTCSKMWWLAKWKRKYTTQAKGQLCSSVWAATYMKAKKNRKRITETCSPHQFTKWDLLFSLPQFSVLTATQRSFFSFFAHAYACILLVLVLFGCEERKRTNYKGKQALYNGSSIFCYGWIL